MFESVEMAPPDPILGLTEAFNKDPNPQKINLSVGVYKDANDKTPVLDSVKEAEKRLLAGETTKSYKPIDGDPAYAVLVQNLLFGAGHEIIDEERAATAHCPGGTGAVRVAADYVKRQHPETTVWISEPTWANHPNVFKVAGLKVRTYPYFDAAGNNLDFPGFVEALGKIPAGDMVLLHGCCHNPTGVDPTSEQWSEIAALVGDRGLLPLVDFAYQGFGAGLEEDAVGVRELCRIGRELLICSSFSKNFGLYSERVGALTVVAASAAAARAVLSHVKAAIRANYSNPPAHGAAIVTTILSDAALRAQWEGELKTMRDRINGTRAHFIEALEARGVDRDFSFILRQKGMFSFSGLTKDQVGKLRAEHSIYIVDSGRINVAGMTDENMDRLCAAIAAVL